MSEEKKKSVCIIGAGPCGMSALYRFGQLEDAKLPEIVCYEKQETYGGLWNFTWQTGTDQFGEPCHASMYRHLWSNGPKECLEYPDYTFDAKYNKPIPSFPPRTLLRDYLEGRFKNSGRDLCKWIKFNTVVKNVSYNKETDDFTVVSRNLVSDETDTRTFSYVIVANGIFSTPNKPTFPGFDTFPGRIIHAHDFRDSSDYKGQTVLVVGASYSAEDVALQCLKYGTKQIICTWRTRAMGFEWPKGIEERPLLKEVEGKEAHFKDGTKAVVDSIVLCTGYQYHYPFLEDDLRLKSKLTQYPNNTYKGMLWLKGGNKKLFYLGMIDQYFTFTLFDVQALWVCKYITGTLEKEPVSMADMQAYCDKWMTRKGTLTDFHDEIDYQGDYMEDLGKDTKYDERARKATDMFHKWEHDKNERIVLYRDKRFKSLFTGTEAAALRCTWMEELDDTIETFVGSTRK